MSIASILGFLATAVIARPSKEDRVAELERENTRLKEDLAFAQEACSRWRNHALASSNQVIAAYRPEAPLTRQNALVRSFADLNRALLEQTLLGQNPQNAQMNAQSGLRSMQNQQSDFLLGMQNLDVGMFCNCVPSRAQVWAADRA